MRFHHFDNLNIVLIRFAHRQRSCRISCHLNITVCLEYHLFPKRVGILPHSQGICILIKQCKLLLKFHKYKNNVCNILIQKRVAYSILLAKAKYFNLLQLTEFLKNYANFLECLDIQLQPKSCMIVTSFANK